MAVTDDLLGQIESRIKASPELSEQERADTLARAKQHVDQQRKNAVIDRLFLEAQQEYQRAYEPDQRIVDILIDLPTYAPFIRLDNIVYFHGLMYEVTAGVASSMQDVMARAWEHQSEIEGRKRRGDQLMTPRNNYVGPANQSSPASQINDLKNFQRV